MSKEIKEGEALDKLLNAINSILEIKESWYDFILVDTSGEQPDDFDMPAGISAIGEDKSIIAVDDQMWNDFTEATNEKKKKRAYAIIAKVISHELMHLNQFKYSLNKHLKDFYYETKLPKNSNKWSLYQQKKYENLTSELEAFAFGKLVESTILQSKRISTLPTYTNRYQFKKVYLQMKDKYEKKIEETFLNNLDVLSSFPHCH
ncbi:MAG: hypothetical protein MJ213_05775 [Bacilli bacterium]|nr:hypothetical protein [Bacilli bacterium]